MFWFSNYILAGRKWDLLSSGIHINSPNNLHTEKFLYHFLVTCTYIDVKIGSDAMLKQFCTLFDNNKIFVIFNYENIKDVTPKKLL